MERSNQRWATDVTHIYCGRNGWYHLPLVIDCAARKILRWRLSKSRKAMVAEAAPKNALIRRLDPGAQKTKDFVLRSDNGLILPAPSYRRTVRDHALGHEFMTPEILT